MNDLVFSEIIMEYNEAIVSGGGIYLYHTIGFTLKNSNFSHNFA